MKKPKIGSLYGDARDAVIQTAWERPAWAPSARQATIAVHFHAEGDQWRVSLSNDPTIPARRLPMDCPLATGKVFIGRYGAPGSDDAGAMPLPTIRRIIQECSTHYLLLLRQAGIFE